MPRSAQCAWATLRASAEFVYTILPTIVANLMRRSQPRIVEAFGQLKTVREWSEDSRYFVDRRCLYNRLRLGWSMEDAITTPKCETRYEAFGEIRSAGEWAKDPRCLVSPRLLFTRLGQGHAREEAMTRPRATDPPLVEAFGECKRLFEWSRDPRCKIARGAVEGRISLGWTMEEALTAPAGAKRSSTRKPPRPPRPKRVFRFFEGSGERKTLVDWVRDPRCAVKSTQALGYRLKAGWPFERALTQVDRFEAKVL